MARKRSLERDKAFQIYREHKGNITNREIATILGIPEKTVGGWKCKDKWDDRINGVLQKNKRSTPKRKGKPGAPKGNKNAVGHGAPPANKNAEKHGFFSKILPEESLELLEELQLKSPLDILWENILIQYAAIARAQKLMFVKNQQDITRHLKRQKDGKTFSEREWEFQYPWDRHANFLQAQSRAMTALNQMIAKYEELLLKDLATEEQKARITKLKAEVAKIKGEEDPTENDGFLEALEGKVSEVWGDGVTGEEA